MLLRYLHAHAVGRNVNRVRSEATVRCDAVRCGSALVPTREPLPSCSGVVWAFVRSPEAPPQNTTGEHSTCAAGHGTVRRCVDAPFSHCAGSCRALCDSSARATQVSESNWRQREQHLQVCLRSLKVDYRRSRMEKGNPEPIVMHYTLPRSLSLRWSAATRNVQNQFGERVQQHVAG